MMIIRLTKLKQANLILMVDADNILYMEELCDIKNNQVMGTLICTLDGDYLSVSERIDEIIKLSEAAIAEEMNTYDARTLLDKIRAEIDELDTLKFSSGERIYKDEVLDIIDKYKAEIKEVEENESI